MVAQAMWDHGCGFMCLGFSRPMSIEPRQNLSAQNVSWGSCFAWNSSLGGGKCVCVCVCFQLSQGSFEFSFKTVDVFCPISCDCSVDNKDLSLGCPRPFGYECDQLEREGCLTYQERAPRASRLPLGNHVLKGVTLGTILFRDGLMHVYPMQHTILEGLNDVKGCEF